MAEPGMYESDLADLDEKQLWAIARSLVRKYGTDVPARHVGQAPDRPWSMEDAQLIQEIWEELAHRGYPAHLPDELPE